MSNNLINWIYKHGSVQIKKLIKFMLIPNVKAECESVQIRNVWLDAYNIEVGLYTYGCFTEGMFAKNTHIGKYCSIAKDVKHLNANHPLQCSCLSPYFYNKALGLNVNDVNRSELTIGNDVWIGYRTIILSNCHYIGNGAVIGAGSIVTKDIPPYAIVAGSPAKIIRYRFSAEICEDLEKSQWWNLEPNSLIKYYDKMYSPKIFSEEILKSR